MLFDLETAQYSLSSEKDRCLLHLWSQERNLVRQVLDAEVKNGNLALTVRRFAQARPIKMEICRDRDRRPPTAQKAARSRYARLWNALCAAICLAGRSTSPGSQPPWIWSEAFRRFTRAACCARTQRVCRYGCEPAGNAGSHWTRRLPLAFSGCMPAVSVKPDKLWLKACGCLFRRRLHPLCRSALPISTMRRPSFNCLNSMSATNRSTQIDLSDHGNIQTRLVRCPDASQVRSRFAATVSKIMALAPQAEVAVISATELSFRLHGLEFARVRLANAPGSFQVAGRNDLWPAWI